MGIVELQVAPPASRNAAPGRSSRGAGLARHKAKKALEADLHKLLLCNNVPWPIPGGRVRATARILFPTERRRDEGNYRDSLEKALGDALAPHDPDQAIRWLPDDQPPAFTFGAVTFGLTEAGWNGRRKPAVAIIRLVWGGDLAAELRRELEELAAA